MGRALLVTALSPLIAALSLAVSPPAPPGTGTGEAPAPTRVRAGVVRSDPSPPVVTRMELDPRRADMLLAKSGARGIPLHELLDGALVLRCDCRRPVRVVLYVFRLRAGKVLGRFRSSVFATRTEGTGALYLSGKGLLPPPSFFGAKALAGPDDILPAARAISATIGVDDPGRFIIDGVFPDKPADWRERDAFFLLAMPADPALQRDAVAWPIGGWYR